MPGMASLAFGAVGTKMQVLLMVPIDPSAEWELLTEQVP